jgi:DDE superfamily endonuclease
VGVFLSYASPLGRALIDRRVYLPRSWTGDRQRCAAAGIPAGVGFATKPELTLDMIADAVAAGMPAALRPMGGEPQVFGDLHRIEPCWHEPSGSQLAAERARMPLTAMADL